MTKSPELTEFHRWLRDWALLEQANLPRARRIQPSAFLAGRIFTGRSHLSQVLNGKRCGRHVWHCLVLHLPPDGRRLLMKLPAWPGYMARKKAAA